MGEEHRIHTDASRAKGLVQRLDQMVARGRVTEAEADRLRSADDDAPFEEVVGDIRARHVASRLAQRVAEGSLSQAEADGLLERVRRGERSRALVKALHGPRPQTGPPQAHTAARPVGQKDAPT